MSTTPRYQHDNTTLQLRSGDRQAFAAVYEQYYLAIYHFARKIINDGQEAEDITAESFIKLWRYAELNTTVQNVKAFLHTTARNACLDYLRSSKLHAEKEKEINFLAQQEAQLTIAEIKSEVLQYVYAEIEKLPTKCREIFKLSYIEGLKVSEVAQQLNISEQTVSNQKTRALKILRLALQHRHWVVLLWLLEETRQ